MQQNIHLPDWLQGRLPIEAVGIGKYRLFIIVVCGAAHDRAAVGAVAHPLRQPPARRRSTTRAWPAASASTSTASSCSPSPSARAWPGLGGALGAEVLGLDPTFPLKFMIYFLIVVSVGGTTTITGPLLAALLLGIADVAGKYYVPKLGAFIVYSLMIVDPDLAAAGPVRAGGGAMSAAGGRRRSPARRYARWRWWELALLAALAAVVARCCRAQALLLNEIAILALFAVSLDLILGYAGIVSLGHAAFFGFGAYAAALFAKHVMPDPLVGLAVAVAVAAAARRWRPAC